ncbi:2Fe-2S iron-sulfur cluster-binding protein [Nocardioides campestrisoli]|uniref:2Fe-2S iron-sulfur cluster-binding protein n=1 Tax=Nocardioides campestrisoli TaxID=2736757 RepID=UPI001CD44A96|nr:2Fe-2S iron-sulfur cluster-binding protein [Nocardioides campestrisoli]
MSTQTSRSGARTGRSAARPAVAHLLEVEEVRRLTAEAVAITFTVPEHLRADYAFEAGQHVAVVGADGTRRPFSLCSSPASGRWQIGVKRLPGGAFSDAEVSRLRPGDRLEVLTPSGRFVAVPDPGRSARYVALAAGSGITPVLSIATALLEEEPGSQVTLICADRTAASAMFLDELHDLKDRFLSRLQLVHVLSREQGEVPLLSGRLDTARLDALLDVFVDRAEVDEWFLCGPQAMVTDLGEHLRRRGAAAVRSELFHAEVAPDSGPAPSTLGTGPASGDRACRVTVRLGGRSSELLLAPGGESVLDAAAVVRRDVPYACKGGVCGTCRARVVSGAVEMAANYALEPDEVAEGYVLTCQSRPTGGPVVLDYDA